MSASINIEVPRNGHYLAEWRLQDDEGAPIDLTGHEIAMTCRAVAGLGGIIASADINILEPTGGAFTVDWDGADFDGVDGPTEIVRLAYDLKHTGGGTVEVPVRGQIILMPKVTP